MAIVSVIELPQRSGTFGIESVEQGWFWKRTYKRQFQVLTSSKYDDAIVVRIAVDPVTNLAIPGVGFVYTNDGLTDATVTHDYGCWAQEVTCEEQERCTQSEGSFWLVTVSYGPYDPNQYPQNPFQRPLEVTWSSSVYQSVAMQDNQGNAIVNSAGDYFDPPLEMDDDRPMLTIVRAEPTYSPILTHQYRDAVNADAFWGFPAGVWKMKDRRGNRVYNVDAGTPSGYYWEVTYEFELNPLGWTRYVLDQGVREIFGGVRINIKDGNGDGVSAPVPLNGRGGVLSVGSPPVFLGYDIYRVLPFEIFNLVDPDAGQ